MLALKSTSLSTFDAPKFGTDITLQDLENQLDIQIPTLHEPDVKLDNNIMTVLEDLDICFDQLKKSEYDTISDNKGHKPADMFKDLLQVTVGVEIDANRPEECKKRTASTSVLNDQLRGKDKPVQTTFQPCITSCDNGALPSEKCPALTAFLLSPESDNQKCDCEKCVIRRESTPRDQFDEEVSSPMEDISLFRSSESECDTAYALQQMITTGENLEQSPGSNASEATSETEMSYGQKSDKDQISGIKLIEELEQELSRVKGSKRNAVQAKLNREKKKLYIYNLEQKVKHTESLNQQVNTQNFALQEENSKLQEEVKFLRKLLSKEGAISCFLDQLPKSSSMQVKDCLPVISNVMVGQKRSADQGDCMMKKLKVAEADLSSDNKSAAGMCLHLSGTTGRATLQFCADCSSMASQQ